MNNPFIKLEDITLSYPVYNHSTSLQKSLLQLKSAGSIEKKDETFQVTALNSISFKLIKGDRVGLIGGNGAGKTTLLRIMSGIYTPSSGVIHHHGKRFCILGTGYGMEEDATGYENILLGGIAAGATLDDIKNKMEDIVSFTELGEYLSMPIRTYSAGMRARLAFAITTSVTPDILLIDEGIGAGDAKFLNKVQERMNSFMSEASILVMASHSIDLIKSFCTKVIYLQSGSIKFLGEVNEGLEKYLADSRA